MIGETYKLTPMNIQKLIIKCIEYWKGVPGGPGYKKYTKKEIEQRKKLYSVQ